MSTKDSNLKSYMSKIGRIGGSAKSEKKAASSSSNLEKARAARWPGKTISLSKSLNPTQEQSFLPKPLGKKSRTIPNNIMKPPRPPRWLKTS